MGSLLVGLGTVAGGITDASRELDDPTDGLVEETASVCGALHCAHLEGVCKSSDV